MSTRRWLAELKAPAVNRGVLAEPDFGLLPRLVEDNRRTLDDPAVLIGGTPLREFRIRARQEALAAARDYLAEHGEERPPRSNLAGPLLVAGHQPELSHPGVWVKHFALYGLARHLDGVPLNLVVDNDTLKRTALRFPAGVGGPADGVHAQSVAFDRLEREEAYEVRTVHDPEMFRTFADRAAPLWTTWGFEPMLPEVWRDIASRRTTTIGEKFAGARRRWERRWGCHNLELPVSRLCQTSAFQDFARHILRDLPRFRDVYNAAIARYREENRVRSANHPAPDLGPAEAPFWTQSSDGRRGRATAKSDPAAVRPRALTLTLFARVCLGDFFIHGIGGGKYDAVTDEIIREYLGIEPPAFQVLSATLHLPLPTFTATADKVRELARRERELFWNPQRNVSGREVEELVHRHGELAAVEPADREGRRARYFEFRRIGEELRSRLEAARQEVAHRRSIAERELAANAILTRRDYSWVLFPESELRPFLQGFLEFNLNNATSGKGTA